MTDRGDCTTQQKEKKEDEDGDMNAILAELRLHRKEFKTLKSQSLSLQSQIGEIHSSIERLLDCKVERPERLTADNREDLKAELESKCLTPASCQPQTQHSLTGSPHYPGLEQHGEANANCRLACFYDETTKDRAEDGQVTVDPTKCTYIIFFSADIEDNKVVPKNGVRQRIAFNTLKKRNPLLKTLLAVGGLKNEDQKFKLMAQTQAGRTAFINSAIRMMRSFLFDGLNIDWRFPDSEDKELFTALCQEARTAFDNTPEKFLLTAPVSAERSIIDSGYEVEKIAKDLYFFNV
ncbi:chitinase-3-like protein 2 [Cheilinus undulatus]|uniref:chitinase-3-like protein 2 n=1 Tax=Cheilinus undulatus TaxID=241271 RepID=UPI001BD35499|nr:chitinase-3-like protein 2 [Cheilinus undulatus]